MISRSTIIEKFQALLRYSIGQQSEAPAILLEEWQDIYAIAEKHAVAGVIFEGIKKRAAAEWNIPKDLMLQWFAPSEQIKKRNLLINQRCVDLTGQLHEEGFQCCILKGQGNTVMYPNPYSRTPGDIDAWMRSKGEMHWKQVEKRVIDYVRHYNPDGRALYHHIDLGDFNGVEVEAHYRPSFMFSPLHNYRLQRWFEEQAMEQFQHEVELPKGVGKIYAPTAEFNIVFQLSHIYNHLLHEGIGLRQIVDYYYLIHNSQCIMHNYEATLRHLGLYKFAGAVMYVMREVFHLEEHYMIVPVEERCGRVLLTEIIRGGNFGMFDTDNIKAKSTLQKNIQRIKRDVRLVQSFPSECICEPLFRTWHYFWRLRYN